MSPTHHTSVAARLMHALQQRNMRLITAESCTAGMVAAALGDIPGASSVLECGFITYSNASKTALLGVDDALIRTHGAVSDPVARAMADGALQRGGAGHIAVSVTGIAGPGGGSAEKPVGTVYIGVAMTDSTSVAFHHHFTGDRREIRRQSVVAALNTCTSALLD